METVSSQNHLRNNTPEICPPNAPQRRLSSLNTKTSASLDNKETTFPRAKQRSLQRKARKHFSMNMVSESMKACATSFIETSDETSIVKHPTRGARFSTLQTCKSVNCPRCAAKHQRSLRDKIEGVFSKVLTDELGKVMLATFTKGYYKSASPKEVRRDLTKSAGNLVKQLNKRWDVNIIYIIEATMNFDNVKPSLFYHIHALIGGNMTEEMSQEIEQYCLEFWLKQNKPKIVRYISPKAQDMRWCEKLNGLADYLAKAASFELSGANTKVAKKEGSTTWFQYLNDLEGEPSEGEKRLVHAFLSAEKGTRKYSSNKTFRATLDSLNLEEEDDENEEVEVATFNVYSARELLRYDDGFLNSDDVLSLLERNDEACKDFRFIASTCDSYYYDDYNADIARELMLDGLCWLLDKYIYENQRRYWVDWRGYTSSLALQ